ncbi:hypothetical protein F503_01541 [Ophiostoma piceae UAMH 11346]|uniref:Tetratricopeptide repeat protein 36 n=1 Tax=Ophiostoma piceae (strain UAMH 11346) TaxID=1262450 RepID=S3CRF6_OPHP1|nr:hypothetical protein F503_01541 [Ophiostoma piceae UAMH 11346]
MAGVSLSRQDIDILGKILDPESSADGVPRLDASLPRDPHITDAEEYAQVSQQERDLVLSLQQADMELAGVGKKALLDPIAAYRTALSGLEELIARYPKYASAMNNRAQALRRLYGDDILLERTEAPSNSDRTSATAAILQGDAATRDEREEAAATVLSDLDRTIALLMPASSSSSSPNPSPTTLSPTANKTLSQAFTQRGALYYATSTHMASGQRCNSRIERPEVEWSREDFEEAAARNFDLGGRFGNDLARELAVGINPTAKLCGQMVQQMMKDEYDPEV